MRKLTALVFSMNPGEILHDLDEVLDLGVRLHAGAVVDLQAVHHFGHALSVQVQEGLNEIAVDETLKMARNFEKNLGEYDEKRLTSMGSVLRSLWKLLQ